VASPFDNASTRANLYVEGNMGKRKLVDRGTEKHFVPRNTEGEFKESDGVGSARACP